MGRISAWWLGFFLLLPFCLRAQQPLEVSEQAFNDHVSGKTEPLYPPIAKAARVTGTVVLQLSIGPDGKIISIRVLSGPAMLQQAALDCAKKWTIKPFEKDGAPVAVTAKTSIVFSLGKDDPPPQEEKLAAAYFPASDDCRAKSRAGGNPADAAATCKKAAEIAEQFPADRRFIEKRSAFVFAAWALLMNNNLDQARHYAEDAVDVVTLGHDDNSGSNAAYTIRAMVEGKAGQFAAADADFSIAEDFERKAIAWGKSEQFEHLDSYNSGLIQDLRMHAQILQAMGKQEDAKKKLEEAASIK